MRHRYPFFRNHSAESSLFTRRVFIALLGVALFTLLLLANLYYLQIHHYHNYHTRSNDNRIKVLPIPPTRGLIYDRNGQLLATNRKVYQLELIPEKIPDLKQTLHDLRPLVNLTDQEIAQFEARRLSRLLTSVPLKTALTEQEVARFSVNQHLFLGVEVKTYLRRYYPYGSALTHVMGYLARMNANEQQWLDKIGQKANYNATEAIGKIGIERYYEQLLHGKMGHEAVEVNSHGHVIRRLYQQAPQAGNNLTLTLDVNLQRYIQQLMQGYCGAVVVMDPRDGGILALVSSPSYDPNLFVDGIAHQHYQALLNDPHRPLINRVTQGLYPPASTVKPFISIAALEEQVITRYSSLFDPGWWQLPGTNKRYRDWKRWGHGQVNLIKALEESSDTFFYQVAYDMGIDRLSLWMHRFGYGESSGLDLAEEQTGIMPTRTWKMQRYRKPWYQGDTIPVGIGQGYWTATPIQMVKALTTLLNNGEVKLPHLLHAQEGTLQTPLFRKGETINLHNPTFWQLAKQGMYGVANHSNGTARKAFANAPYKAAVKSGTCQLFSFKDNQLYQPEKLAKRLHDHALLIAFAPYQHPEVALAVVMENEGGGSSAAAPLVRKILDYILLHPSHSNTIAATVTSDESLSLKNSH